MGLPVPPAYSFALPSLHDDTALDCRVYHPPDLSTWHAKAAVLAHPYAPLGGSYDDPVLQELTAELLAAGWVVGLFNFRGAGGSAGHTSWTGRPELSDYITVAGFMAHFMDQVRPRDEEGHAPVKLLLGGYSYGSLIVARLPSTQDMLARFSNPEDGSPAARVLLRAQSLAAQTIAELQDRQEAELHDNGTRTPRDEVGKKGRTHSHTRSITLGGDDSDETSRGSSRDARRSGSLGLHGNIRRHSWREHHQRRKRERAKAAHGTAPSAAQSSPDQMQESGVVLQVQTAYLLVSPLLLPTSLFVAPALLRLRAAESELTRRRALAVFGGRDMFTSRRRLRPWAQKLAEESGGRFQWEEVRGVGHFWHEKGAMRALRERMRRWVDGL